MLGSLSAAALEDWQLFDQDEPLGPRESRQQIALLLAKVHNRWREKGTKPLSAKDFMLQPAPDPVEDEQKNKRAMIDTLRAMARPAAERPRHRKHPRALKKLQAGKRKQ